MASSTIGLVLAVALYDLFILITVGLLVHYREDPYFAYRNVVITSIVGITSAILLPVVVFVTSIPPWLFLYLINTFFPLIFICITGKVLQLTFLYYSSQAKLNRGEDCASSQNSQTSLSRPETNVFYRYQRYFNNRVWFTWCGIELTIYIILTSIILFTSHSLPTDFSAIPIAALTPIFLSYSLHLLIQWPIFVWYLRSVDDAFHIRFGLSIVEMVELFSFIGLILRATLSYIKIHWEAYAIYCAVRIILIHTAIVVFPLCRRPRTPRAADEFLPVYDIGSLLSILKDPILYEDFKKFSLRIFAVENTLFYRRCMDLKANSQIPIITNIKEVTRIYDMFIQPNSDMEVNITEDVQHQVTLVFQKPLNDGYPIDIFDQAMNQVLEIMYHDIFPRYLAYKNLLNV
ncbi:Regulator of G-protein signaling [Basidiobolus ranarum]|uniref:Regulator of G-protein signaling n=1 Tax=Basidiobolus ranarum TaxID=34480 RepID=A0ABR2WXC3_9FUNG